MTAETAPGTRPPLDQPAGRPRRWRALAAIAAVGAAALAPVGLVGCALTGDETFELIPSDEIPFGLDQTTTTTTTTTIPTEPVESPETTTTTTTPTVQTAPVEIYFVIGLERLQHQTLQLSFPVEPRQVLLQLEEGPPADQSSVGLRTALRPNLTTWVDNVDGVATIDLQRIVLDRMTPRDLNLAIAQLVLTVTRLPGVGQVRFTRDGEPLEIPVPPTMTMSEPGEPLSYSMFADLVSGPGGPGTTDPPAITTTTAPPPPINPDPPTGDPADPEDPPAGEEPDEPADPDDPANPSDPGEGDPGDDEPVDGSDAAPGDPDDAGDQDDSGDASDQSGNERPDTDDADGADGLSDPAANPGR